MWNTGFWTAGFWVEGFWNETPAVQLAGVVAATSTLSGSLQVLKYLAGLLSANSTLAGDLDVIKYLAGRVDIVSTLSGALIGAAIDGVRMLAVVTMRLPYATVAEYQPRAAVSIMLPSASITEGV